MEFRRRALERPATVTPGHAPLVILANARIQEATRTLRLAQAPLTRSVRRLEAARRGLLDPRVRGDDNLLFERIWVVDRGRHSHNEASHDHRGQRPRLQFVALTGNHIWNGGELSLLRRDPLGAAFSYVAEEAARAFLPGEFLRMRERFIARNAQRREAGFS